VAKPITSVPPPCRAGTGCRSFRPGACGRRRRPGRDAGNGQVMVHSKTRRIANNFCLKLSLI